MGHVVVVSTNEAVLFPIKHNLVFVNQILYIQSGQIICRFFLKYLFHWHSV